MAKYIVLIREVWVQGCAVEADSEAEAIATVHDPSVVWDADGQLFEYSYTLDKKHSTASLASEEDS